MLFLKNNYEKLPKIENIISYNDEINYYKVCFTPQELMDIFTYKKENDEKTEYFLLLNQISQKQITKENLHFIFDDLEKIKENLSTFNQPIDFTNKELYFYIHKATIIIEILKQKEKKNLQKLKNIQTSIKLAFEKKLFENDNIINDEIKFSRLMIMILRGQEEEIVKYNLNLLNEIIYTEEEKKALISNINNSLFFKNKLIPRLFPGFVVDTSKIQFDKIDNKYNFSNILIQLKSEEKSDDFESLKDEYLLNYYKEKLDFNKIKSLMKKILSSKCIKEAFSEFYGEKYKYPFINKEETSKYIDKYIDFIVIKDKTSQGITNKFTLQTKLFLNKFKDVQPCNIEEVILYDGLYSGFIINTFLYELDTIFNSLYYYHSNCSFPLTNPSTKKIDRRKVGIYFQLLKLQKSIKRFNLNQALFLLNEKNYNKNLHEFSGDFQKLNEEDLLIKGEFSSLNEEITKLKDDDEDLDNYYIKIYENKKY